MQFNNTDTAILYALKTWGSESVVTELRNIISFMDYYDRSILTYLEFSTSVNKLLQSGFVLQTGQKLNVDKAYSQWWDKKYGKKQVALTKELKETKEFLNTNFSTGGSSKIETIISSVEFDAAVKFYLSK